MHALRHLRSVIPARGLTRLLAAPSADAAIARLFSSKVKGREALLFTPGPLTTSPAVKQAMLVDLGSRDDAFLRVVREVREKLLTAANVSQKDGYECVIMQGSGTFAVESVVSSTIPRDGKLLVIANGAYGERMAKMCQILNIDHTVIRYKDWQSPRLEDIRRVLESDKKITHVGVIHSETTSGLINDVHAIGTLVGQLRPDVKFIVDAMSSFGAVPVDVRASNITYLVSSSNKCIEGVPGFAYVLAQRDALKATDGFARSLSLDLVSQWKGLEANGQFRFTPPTHALLAFHQALLEFEAEGGVAGRQARYEGLQRQLAEGMKQMGFDTYVEPQHQGPIITTFLEPTDPNFNFKVFYDRLSEHGLVIYPGKLTEANSFRIGSIGRIFPSDMRLLLITIEKILTEMGVKLPVQCAPMKRQ
eukprot:GILI01004344.1.p1 GENE.GILI01004344.1~~GILI01004344.1.p1  ORF type:complete len:435 (-),score=143.71 GILI01004344.1:255-1511(-)